MTTAKPPARYSAMESTRAGDFATPELHHPSGHDLPACPYARAADFQSAFGRYLFLVTKLVKRAVATLTPVLRSHVALLSAGAWNKHEQSMRPVGLLRCVHGVRKKAAKPRR